MELSDTCLPASQQTREFHVIGWVERSGEGCPLVHAPVRVHVASLAWPSRLENDHRGEQKLTGQRPRMSPWSQLESTRLTLPEELAEVPPVPVDLSFLSVRRECTATHFLPCTHSREKKSTSDDFLLLDRSKSVENYVPLPSSVRKWLRKSRSGFLISCSDRKKIIDHFIFV